MLRTLERAVSAMASDRYMGPLHIEDDDGNVPEAAPQPSTLFQPRGARPVSTHMVTVDNQWGRWTGVEKRKITLTINKYLEHTYGEYVYLFTAGGREYIHRNMYPGCPFSVHNLDERIFNTPEWGIAPSAQAAVDSVILNTPTTGFETIDTIFTVNK